eukprot:TRINITY_DN1653_c0_g1_i1.p1 TRINITY_DN1653_c0_g1~~TRINITY_DN1653_c0_g1_i1.p1  ORF type:complete len:94 (+),score=33.09 TRINITY_DN1653_c0_g1_i1:34-315(+)
MKIKRKGARQRKRLMSLDDFGRPATPDPSYILELARNTEALRSTLLRKRKPKRKTKSTAETQPRQAMKQTALEGLPDKVEEEKEKVPTAWPLV